MACNNCHKHGGGMFDEELLRHNSTRDISGSIVQPNNKNTMLWILAGVFVLGTVFLKSKI
jgi:hypothetical protein